MAVEVAPGKTVSIAGTYAGGAAEGGLRTIAIIAGVILGAIIGAVLGVAIVGETLAIVLGAIVGAIIGAAIAGAVARAGGGRGGHRPIRSRCAPGSVTLTVTADSAAQAQEAREILTRGGGVIRP